MPRRSGAQLAAAAAVGAVALAGRVGAQQAAPADSALLGRAFALEASDKPREAAPLYRSALKRGTAAAAMLGLERVYAELGWADTLIAVADSAVRAYPADPTIRTVQLRALRMAGRASAARIAYERWTAAAPRDPAPYREFARLLLEAQETAAADSVLRTAAARLGDTRQLSLELAQLRAALGMWDAAAAAWRVAVDDADYLAPAAALSLTPAPAEHRDAVRSTLSAPTATLGARRTLAALELAWGAGARAWAALGGLPPNARTLAAWEEFGEQAEAAGAWGAARDAFAAVDAIRPGAATAGRSAAAAIAAGDGAAALEIVTRAEARGGEAVRRALLPLRVKALVALGRTEEAERVAQAAAGALDAEASGDAMQSVAWGWVRAGDVARARRALALAADAEGVETIEGWLALYEGDLRTARRRLRAAPGATAELVDALALLARTRADSSAAAGAAYLTLARGDTAAAAAAFVAAAPEVPGATPLLLARAARLYAAARQPDRAVALWTRLVSEHGSAPEAPEADLEWARALRRAGRSAEAAARLEHLILTYPDSALVAQARRELESIRNGQVASD